MFRLLLCAGMLICASAAFSQMPLSAYEQKVAQLKRQIALARSDSEKVVSLGKLAMYYYIYKANAKADSVLERQLTIAEESANRNLILTVLFTYTSHNINSWNSVSTFDKALSFVEQGLAYARLIGKHDYQALAHIRKAAILRNRGRYDAALEQTAQASLALEKSSQDSIKCVLLLEMGDIFLAKGNAVTAYEHYNSAYDIGYVHKNSELQTQANHRIALLYNSLGRADLAENILKASLEANLRNQYTEGILFDYVDLARVVEKKEYIEKALELSNSLGSERNRIFAKQLMFAYHMVVDKDSKAALHYLIQNRDLHQLHTNRGQAHLNWQTGSIYFYASQPDSAIHYFVQAEPELRQTMDAPGLIEINAQIGASYVQLGHPSKALPYFTEALDLAKNTGTLLSNRHLLLTMSRIQAMVGNYKSANSFSEQYLAFTDSASRINNGRELALLEVERVNNQHQHDLAEMEHQAEREKYLQYNIISLAIVVLFMFLIVVGMFRVPPFVTRMMGYFSFICLFEFFILLIDTKLHHAAHGKPLFIWLGKIVVIAMLVPIHHFLEHAVIKFIQSQKLKELRKLMAAHSWRPGKKPTLSTVPKEVQTDTATT